MLIHQLSDEIKSFEKDFKVLKNHQSYLQFYSLVMRIAINEGKTIEEVHNEIVHYNSAVAPSHVSVILMFLSWDKRGEKIIISNNGECLNAATGEKINTVEKLMKAIYESKF